MKETFTVENPGSVDVMSGKNSKIFSFLYLGF